MDMDPNNRAYIGASLAIDMSSSCHVLAHSVSFNLIPKSLLFVEAMYIRFASYLFDNSANDAIERAGLRRICARIAWRRPGTIVHFKRLGSRHIHKEIEIPCCVFGFNVIICRTGLKHIQALTHKCNIIKEEHFKAI